MVGLFLWCRNESAKVGREQVSRVTDKEKEEGGGERTDGERRRWPGGARSGRAGKRRVGNNRAAND